MGWVIEAISAAKVFIIIIIIITMTKFFQDTFRKVPQDKRSSSKFQTRKDLPAFLLSKQWVQSRSLLPEQIISQSRTMETLTGKIKHTDRALCIHTMDRLLSRSLQSPYVLLLRCNGETSLKWHFVTLNKARMKRYMGKSLDGGGKPIHHRFSMRKCHLLLPFLHRQFLLPCNLIKQQFSQTHICGTMKHQFQPSFCTQLDWHVKPLHS